MKSVSAKTSLFAYSYLKFMPKQHALLNLELIRKRYSTQKDFLTACLIKVLEKRNATLNENEASYSEKSSHIVSFVKTLLKFCMLNLTFVIKCQL